MCDQKGAGISRQRKSKQEHGIQPGGGVKVEPMGAVTGGWDARRAGGQLTWALETPGKNLAVPKSAGKLLDVFKQ